MIIHSKFKDYYDSIMKYGQDDRDYHWSRIQKEILIKRLESNYYREYSNDTHKINKEKWIYFSSWNYDIKLTGERCWLLFCGKVYPMIEIKDKLLGVYHAYSIDDYIKINTNLDKKYKINSCESKEMKKFFRCYGTDIGNEYFIEYKSPIILLRKSSNVDIQLNSHKSLITINPKLRDINFQKVFDPYTTFQEIDMYLNSILVNIEPTHEPFSDIVMRDSKGFDKMTFKKYPTKK